MNQDTPIAPEQPEVIAKTLDALPGLVGAIDRVLKDEVGQVMPFVLLVFHGNGAMHATNFDAGAAANAVRQLGREWDKAEGDTSVDTPVDTPAEPWDNAGRHARGPKGH